ncbi:MAG: PilZ domain-containing protein [Bacteriovoracaceae bacterium]
MGEIQKEFFERATRIGGDLVKDLSLSILNKGNDVTAKVINISQSGLFLSIEGFPVEMGQSFQFKMDYGEHSVDFDAEVVRFEDNLWGLKVSENLIAYRSFVGFYFEAEIASVNATVVPPNRLKPEQKGSPVWIVSKDGYSLYFVTYDSELLKFSFHYDNYYFERNEEGKCQLYEVEAHEGFTEFGPSYKMSDLLRLVKGENFDFDVIKKLQRFVMALSQIDKSVKAQILVEVNSFTPSFGD